MQLKTTILYSVFFAFGLVLSPMAVAHASSAMADSVHFCLPFDYEQWRRNHPRPAAKRLANLNIGEPRTVRLIYFLPNDRPFRQEVVDSMKVAIRNIQIFYGEQMQAHEYGDKTFRFETDAQSEPLVHRVDGQHPDSHYLDDTFGSVLQEIESVFDVRENIYLVVIDNSADLIIDEAQNIAGIGRASRVTKSGGFALVTGGLSLRTAAHELGHTFGLYHNFYQVEYIMSYGSPGLQGSILSPCHAEFLAVHPYFNSDSPIEEALPPTVKLISSPIYPAGSDSVSVQLELSDSEGLHQVFLLGHQSHGDEVWECRGLANKKEAVVEFGYDGYSAFNADWWSRIRRLSDQSQHRIRVLAVDTKGNVSEDSFVLEVDDPSKLPRVPVIAKISGINQQGPVGEQLAYPFIVEVRDQDDNPLPGTRVTFSIIAGQGRLSGRFSVEHTTTDVNGRAQSILTLGPDPGSNIVNVSAPKLQGCEPVFFKTIGFKVPTLSSVDGDYRTWNLPDGATVRLGKGRIGGVSGSWNGSSDRAVAFSPDGQRLAVASGIGLWFYDVATSRELALLPTESQAHSVAFSRDGTMLASGLHDGTITLWDASTLAPVATLSDIWSRGVTSVSFSRDGTMLASGTYDGGMVKLWDVATKENIATYGSEGKQLSTSVSFSPDGMMLASGSDDGTVKLWDVATGTQIATFSGHRLHVTSVSFSLDGMMLASGSRDGTVKLWDVATRENITTFEGHISWVTSVAFSPDGMTLASGSDDYTVKLWDVATRENIATFEGHISWVWSVSFSPDGKTLASGSFNNTIKLWDIASGANKATFSRGKGQILSMAFSPNGATLAVGDPAGVVLWDTTGPYTFNPRCRLCPTDIASVPHVATPLGHTDFVSSVAFSPDGKILASMSFSRSSDGVALWDASTLTYIATIEGYTSATLAFSFSPDSKTLASGEVDGTVKLWDVGTREQIATLEGRAGWGSVVSVSFSPDGTTLASGSDGTVKLWDVGTREQIANLEGHSDWVRSLSFSPNGATLASGSEDGTVLLWDMHAITQPQPQTLVKISGDKQEGVPSAALANPLVVEVKDKNGNVLEGVVVTFAVTGGDGTLSVKTTMTDSSGRAQTTLTLGSDPGTNIVAVTVTGIEHPVTFAIESMATPDFDSDGIVGFADFLLFVVQFGFSEDDEGYNARYDLDGDGTIGFGDFLIFANSFGTEAS